MTITRWDTVQKDLSPRRLSEDYADRLIAQFTNPEYIVDRFAPKVFDRVDHYSQVVDTIRRLVLSGLLILAVARVLTWLPGDLARERRTALFYDQQRQRDCTAEYIENNCTEEDASPACAELDSCLANPNQELRTVSFLKFTWNIVNAFFYALSNKAAIFLGIVVGLFLYRDFQRAQHH
jgi:hypothetical protein